MDVTSKFHRLQDIFDEANDTLSDILEDDELEHEHFSSLRNSVRSLQDQSRRMESMTNRFLSELESAKRKVMAEEMAKKEESERASND
jgi:hypothetical protein